MSGGARNDTEEISARLASGSRDALEEAALILDSFPHGEADGFGYGLLGPVGLLARVVAGRLLRSSG